VRVSTEGARRPRGRIWLGAFLALLTLLFPGAAPAQTFPKFTNFVVDQANVIPPAIEGRLDAAAPLEIAGR
jgi:hypothetical protein